MYGPWKWGCGEMEVEVEMEMGMEMDVEMDVICKCDGRTCCHVLLTLSYVDEWQWVHFFRGNRCLLAVVR